MGSRTVSAWTAILVLLSSAAPATAGVIYDNTTNNIPGLSFTALQIGNEVQAAGLARQVIELDIGVNQQGEPGTADFQAFLYANDGSGGQPGTLLWASPVHTNVALTGGNDLIAFAVPHVTVPDLFTWAIQGSNETPVAVGLPAFDPPTVGAVVHSWFGGPGIWTSLDELGAISHFEARVTAVTIPEPASAVLLGLGSAALAGFAWRRRESVVEDCG